MCRKSFNRLHFLASRFRWHCRKFRTPWSLGNKAHDLLKGEHSPAEYECLRDSLLDLASAVKQATDSFDDQELERRKLDDEIADIKKARRPLDNAYDDLKEMAKRANNAFWDAKRRMRSQNIN
jgi:hypothetical protein